jgi:quercetin dioxygenase-like cupin family protein
MEREAFSRAEAEVDMMRTTKPLSRAQLLIVLIAIAAPIWVAGQGSNFSGGTPASVDAKAVRTTRLRFPKGSRSNWHSHTWGQLLMIEEGRGRTQVRGGPLLETAPGQPWWTAAGVEHWHGAAPDQDALQLTIYEGDVKWLEPVTDQQYLAAPRK